MSILSVCASDGSPPFRYCLLRRMCQKSKQYVPKGQKPIAQGNTLGKSITNTNAPCKGKSVNYQCFCPCRALCYY